MRGHNDDFLYDSSENPLLEFFSKAGSLFEKRGNYYDGASSALELFKPAFTTDEFRAMKLAFWLRDCRGGSGNRSGFRSIVKWICERNPDWVIANIDLIPQVGRWDDLISCFGTNAETAAVCCWARSVADKDGLACKWVPRINSKSSVLSKTVFSKLRKELDMSPKDFRKFVSENTNVIETKMCSNEWSDIDYSKVPSVAMARSNKAFSKHDAARFDQWKNSLGDPDSDTKVNASVLFPHDCIRTLMAEIGGGSYYYNRAGSQTESKLANAQFAALPNYLEGTDQRIMPICDFSGSMSCKVAGEIKAIDVSLGLGLYCSDRVGEENPFYRMFIPFSNTSKLVSWRDQSFSIAAQAHNDGFCGSTNVKAALDQILQSAKMFNATDEQIPNCLLILSDMQFDRGGVSGSNSTVVEQALQEWVDAGYSRPRIVYWNLAAYQGSPATGAHQDVAMISGFSPSTMSAVLGGTDFSPMAVLDRAIDKYEVTIPSDELVEEVLETI